MKQQMQNVIVKFFFIACLVILLGNCKKAETARLSAPDILHQNQDLLTEVIIYDVFSPPVASRIYVYSSLASYEAIRFAKAGTESIAEQLPGFGKMPEPETGRTYDYILAATRAFLP